MLHRTETRALRLLLALVVAPAATGCVEWIGSQSILVIDHAVPAHVYGPGCEVDGEDTALATGVLDVFYETPYRAGLQVQLNLPSTQNTQAVQQDNQRSPNYQFYGDVDSNTVVVEEVLVSMIDDVGNEIPGLPRAGQERRSPASGVLFNEQQNLNAQKTIFVNAITAAESKVILDGRIGADLGPGETKTILVTVQLSGYTSGGGQILSSKFTVPIEICVGCLRPSALVNGVCPGGTAERPQTCLPPGQDLPMVCQ